MNLDPSVATLLLAARAGTGGAQAEAQLPGSATRLPEALINRLVAAVRTIVVSGTVMQSQTAGTVTLRTQFGPLQFQSSSPVPVGGQAVLTIPPPGPGMSAAALSARPVPATLLLPNGTAAAPTASAAPGASPITGSALPSAPLLPGGQPLSELGALRSAASQSLPASVTGPAAAAGPASAPSTAAATTSAASGSPAAHTAPQAPAVQAGAAGAQTATTANVGPQAPNVRGPLPNQATQLYGRAAASAGTASPSGPIAAGPATHGMAGQPGAAATGQAALPDARTGLLPSQSLKSPPPSAHRPGLAPPTSVPGGAAANATAATGIVASGLGEGLAPALREALTALSQLDPALAGQAAQRSVPQPGPQMGTALLLFVAAARGGDVRGWLGDKSMRLLEARGKSDVASRLSTEFTALTRQLTEAPAAEWRSLAIPIFDRGAWSELQLHIGPPPQEDSADPTRPRGKRFVIDVTLSRLGPLQLDGTLTARHLDLAVRTQDPFSLAERQEMSATFASTCEGTGLTGTLVFQPGGHNWLRLAGAGEGRDTR